MVDVVAKRAVGVFSNYQDAEQAINALQNSGFSANNVSIIARDAEVQEDIAGVDVSEFGTKTNEGAAAGALTGGILGGLTGLLVGLGSLVVPGVGPVLFAGEVASALTATLAGGAMGAAAGGLLGALLGLGIPEERAKIYDDRVSGGDYLVIVDGTVDEILKAEAILMNYRIQELGIYDIPEAAGSQALFSDTTHNINEAAHGRPTTETMTTDPQVTIIDRREQV